ncbi:MAG: DUF302 domain-containing protein [Chromatiales bacterium]|nr:DUF302 domain-containing protein [Chromatiales bacterium]MDX9767940.1 DUF302 domain-containing protein [Ectothiorhodospiraceae bacterium]
MYRGLGRLLPALALLIASLPLQAAEPVLENAHMTVYRAAGGFEVYREGVEMAITNRGMVINNVSHIGNMLERTAADVGGERLYGKGEALEFCSSLVSRRMMEADRHNIVFCPYIIAIYTLPDDAEHSYIAFRRPPRLADEASRNSMREVEALLEEIVQEALAAF